MSGDGSLARRRYESLYRTLLTPVALIVTVSGVSYVNAGTVFGIHGILGFYVTAMGCAVMLLISSALIYSVAHLDIKKCRRDTYRLAFGLLIISPFLSSSLLIAQAVTLAFGAESNSSVTFVAFASYCMIGILSTLSFIQLAFKS